MKYIHIHDVYSNQDILKKLKKDGEYVADATGIYIDLYKVKKRTRGKLPFKLKDIIGTYEFTDELPDSIAKTFNKMDKVQQLLKKKKVKVDPIVEEPQHFEFITHVLEYLYYRFIRDLDIKEHSNLIITPITIIFNNKTGYPQYLVLHFLSNDIDKYGVVEFSDDLTILDVRYGDDYEKLIRSKSILN